jgi:hypothetical protein
MKWIRKFLFCVLKLIGVPMSSMHKKCISILEERLAEIDDDEYFIAVTMLDSGNDCESVYNTIRIARRKRAFKRKLIQLGIKGASLEHLVDNFLADLRGATKIDELVQKAHQDYLEAAEKRKVTKTNSM